jgi:hypothetical protein
MLDLPSPVGVGAPDKEDTTVIKERPVYLSRLGLNNGRGEKLKVMAWRGHGGKRVGSKQSVRKQAGKVHATSTNMEGVYEMPLVILVVGKSEVSDVNLVTGLER